MKLRFVWRRQHGPLFAWVVMLLSTASYLAIVEAFDLKPVLFTIFIVLSVAVLAYWIPGEPTHKKPKQPDADCDEA